MRSYYWYDLETFGISPKYDRVAQFAGQRTDEQLNPIGDPLVLYARPTEDYLPDPFACLITGITPQIALKKGISEPEFIKKIDEEFNKPGTCVTGYNNIRFDDEFIRYMYYRNFYDPFAREYGSGRSRWDIIDMVRLTRALRPEGINWPVVDGKPSNRLEHITEANNIEHGDAHDALSDVNATISVAKLIKTKQPKLFDFVFSHRNKESVLKLLNPSNPKPIIHTSGKYPSEYLKTAMVLPLAFEPQNGREIIVYDVKIDPSPLLDGSVDDIRRLLFSKKADLDDGEERLPIKTIRPNRSPVLAPASVLDEASAARIGLNQSHAEKHIKLLLDNKAEIEKKLSEAFKDKEPFKPETEPDIMIYEGFFSDGDKIQMEKVRQCLQDDLASLKPFFKDKRLKELLWLYKARNFPSILTDSERAKWEEFRISRLTNSDFRTFEEFAKLLEKAASQPELTDEQKFTLEELKLFAQSLS